MPVTVPERLGASQINSLVVEATAQQRQLQSAKANIARREYLGKNLDYFEMYLWGQLHMLDALKKKPTCGRRVLLRLLDAESQAKGRIAYIRENFSSDVPIDEMHGLLRATAALYGGWEILKRLNVIKDRDDELYIFDLNGRTPRHYEIIERQISKVKEVLGQP